ncbi:MAG: hypothetical protein LBB12_01690 [Holosporaceae bacterium]|jgi:DNA-binding transcriptional regulator YbjK|nr:hypothetical protein [Holosporaceae bacterium]
MTEMTEEKQNTISMTHAQFNELNSLIEKALASVGSAHYATAPAFRLMPKKCGRATICKIADDLVTARHAFIDISELLQEVQYNYKNEKRNKTITESMSMEAHND